MAVAHRSASAVIGTGTAPTGTEPAGTVTGDVVFALFIIAAAGGTAGLPAGWTSLLTFTSTNTQFKVVLGRIVRGASAPSYVFTQTTSAYRELYLWSVSAADNTTPLDVAIVSGAQNFVSGGRTTSVDPGSSGALVTANCLAYAIGVDWNGSTAGWTPPAGYTLRSDNTIGNDGMVASKALTATTAEDPGAFTSGSMGAPNDGWAATLIVRPSSGSTAVPVSDTVAATDASSMAPGLTRTEAAALAESSSINGGATNIGATDAVGVSDIDFTIDAPRTSPEVTVTDTAAVSVTGPTSIAASDAVGVSDIDFTITAPRTSPEVTVTDTAFVTQSQGVNDQGALGETGAQIDTDDNAVDVTLGESAQVGTQTAIGATDSAAATEASQAPNLRTSDQGTVGDVAQVSSSASVNQVTVADQVAESEQPSDVVQTAGRPVNDQGTLGEQAGLDVGAFRVDATIAGDASSLNTGQQVDTGDQAAASEQAAVALRLAAAAAEQAALAELSQVDLTAAPDTPIHITLRLADAGATVYDVGDEAFVDVTFTDADTGNTISPDQVAAVVLRPDWSVASLVPFAHASGYRVPLQLDTAGPWRVKVSCGAPGPSVETVLLYARA